MYDVKPITSPIPVDCGPTSLQMLLAFYGVDVPLEQLISECNMGITGCSMADVGRAARLHGIDTKYYQMDAEELIKQDRPAIIWWRYDHFCVFCGLNERGDVVICNPDRGRFGLDPDTFAALYSGRAMFNGCPNDLTGDYWGEHVVIPDYFKD